MCLGFLYHTLRYVELFAGIRATGARHIIIDTRITLDPRRVIKIYSNPVEKESMAVEDRFTYKGKSQAASPSMAALEHMLLVYGYDIANETDWSQILADFPGREGLVERYAEGKRVTLLAVSKD